MTSLPRRGSGAFTHTMSPRPLCLGRAQPGSLCGPQFSAVSVLCRNISMTPSVSGQTGYVRAEHLQCRACTDGNEWPRYGSAPADTPPAMNWPGAGKLELGSLLHPGAVWTAHVHRVERTYLSQTDKIYRDGSRTWERMIFWRYLKTRGHSGRCRCRGYFHWSLLTTHEWQQRIQSVLVWCTSITLPAAHPRYAWWRGSRGQWRVHLTK